MRPVTIRVETRWCFRQTEQKGTKPSRLGAIRVKVITLVVTCILEKYRQDEDPDIDIKLNELKALICDRDNFLTERHLDKMEISM